MLKSETFACRPKRIRPDSRISSSQATTVPATDSTRGDEGSMASGCCGNGGSESLGPLHAMDAPKEKILYVLCLQSPENENTKSGYIATVDADPESNKYGQVIHRLHTDDPQDELHHFGWNSCVSCKNPAIKRRYLIVPALRTGNIYIVDTIKPSEPSLHKTISGSSVQSRFKITYPHTVHCIPSGEVMISYMGDYRGNAKGSFLLLDGETFEPKGLWNQGNEQLMGYDFWYQPRHNVMVSSEFGAPKSFMKGFHVGDVAKGLYGTKLHFWNWEQRTLINSLQLPADGAIPLEIRFLHNPESAVGFVGCALGSTVYLVYKGEGETWEAKKVITVPPKTVENWVFPSMPSLITDILVSLDDKFLYFANFVHGDVRQYNITDPENPVLVSSVFLGGSICKGGSVNVTEDAELTEQPDRPSLKGVSLQGAPNMLQLSRDGKRLYVTFSLVTPWDLQFYPEACKQGSGMVVLDCSDAGMKLNEDFFVNLGGEPDGPVRGHEVRYPGGDCSSDIWL
ncbi:Selenium-binding protein 1 [Hypsibius exemplaris]|uniref:Selenium-binding protein 1 n=1 Tax=Hypsibius exemplaris TaxID=2072580 RepID=A0A1W0WKK4_HYPEX|nr:Selenium-binding protein 1 [Hypsibius exemplaris]